MNHIKLVVPGPVLLADIVDFKDKVWRNPFVGWWEKAHDMDGYWNELASCQAYTASKGLTIRVSISHIQGPRSKTCCHFGKIGDRKRVLER